jgi:hypothetical protein
LLIWYMILREWGLTRHIALATCFLLALFEPFFGAANQIRIDMLVFTLAAAALLAAMRRYWLIAGLLSAAALECHPMGLLAPLHVALAFSLRSPAGAERYRAIGLSLLGLGIGAAGYFLLHNPDFAGLLHTLIHTPRAVSRNGIPNFLWEYFFQTKYYRHVPELLLTIVAATVLWRRRKESPNAITALSLLAFYLMFALISPRANFHYMVFVMPAFVLAWTVAADSFGRLALLTAGLAIWMLAQYGILWTMHHGREPEREFGHLRAAIPDDGRAIVGPPMLYFAFLDRAYYTNEAGIRYEQNAQESYWRIPEGAGRPVLVER